MDNQDRPEMLNGHEPRGSRTHRTLLNVIFVCAFVMVILFFIFMAAFAFRAIVWLLTGG